jgi:hypothetical protein
LIEHLYIRNHGPALIVAVQRLVVLTIAYQHDLRDARFHRHEAFVINGLAVNSVPECSLRRYGRHVVLPVHHEGPAASHGLHIAVHGERANTTGAVWVYLVQVADGRPSIHDLLARLRQRGLASEEDSGAPA